MEGSPPVPVQGDQYGPRGCLAQGYSAPPFGIRQAPLPLEFPGGVVAAVRPSCACGGFGFPRSHGAPYVFFLPPNAHWVRYSEA